jgi:hypothetical protein
MVVLGVYQPQVVLVVGVEQQHPVLFVALVEMAQQLQFQEVQQLMLVVVVEEMILPLELVELAEVEMANMQYPH